eukprot:3707663-Prymnesium_polylepis.1
MGWWAGRPGCGGGPSPDREARACLRLHAALCSRSVVCSAPGGARTARLPPAVERRSRASRG